MTVLVRSKLDNSALSGLIREEVVSIDPDQPLASVMTVDQMLAERIAPRRFNTILLVIFAGMALALAAVGTYGVVSYLVAMRTREIGVRLAVGATASDVFRLVVRQVGLLLAAGIALGIAGSAALSQLISAFLYGIPQFDPVSFTSGPIILLLTGALAVAAPIRRALRVDPVEALRAE